LSAGGHSGKQQGQRQQNASRKLRRPVFCQLQYGEWCVGCVGVMLGLRGMLVI